MTLPTVLVETRPEYRVLTLNRPEKLNAFTREMHAALAAALDEAVADRACRAVLLTGAGRGFCAGQDLAERLAAPGGAAPDLAAAIETTYNPLIRKLRALPIPVVCAVNGVAAGAGANIALAGDLVIAARSWRSGRLGSAGGRRPARAATGGVAAAGVRGNGDRAPIVRPRDPPWA